MRTEPPPARRKFADARDEIEYLYHKLLYWLYEREDRARARAYADRLEWLLTKACPGHEAILPEGCRSLICEARGDLTGAIRHRENEVRLTKRLHEISRNSAQQEGILRLHGYEDLSDRLDLLAMLYHDRGDLDKAIVTLRVSEQLCARHGIKFAGADVLQDYLEERGKGMKTRGQGPLAPPNKPMPGMRESRAFPMPGKKETAKIR
jgi:hypothetical protein